MERIWYYLDFEWLCKAVYYGEMTEEEAEEIAYCIVFDL